jgi:hypothetical protein
VFWAGKKTSLGGVIYRGSTLYSLTLTLIAKVGITGPIWCEIKAAVICKTLNRAIAEEGCKNLVFNQRWLIKNSTLNGGFETRVSNVTKLLNI